MEEMMNCDLDLHLHPSSASPSSSSISPSLLSKDHQQHQQQLRMKEMSGEQLPLTIFYGGEVCVGNVTHQQARSIMHLAGRAVNESWKTTVSDTSTQNLLQPSSSPQAMSNSTSFSMKRSLQSFLEKRKHRIQSTSSPCLEREQERGQCV